MTPEEKVKKDLEAKFNYPEDKIKLPRARRLFLEVDYSDLPAVFEYAVKQLKFTHLITITGLDQGQNLGFIYHLAQDSGTVLNLKTSVLKDAPIKTVTDYFPGAQIYEQELVDLFGAKVQGLPEGNRYPLTDDWPKGQYPLRKDWEPGSIKKARQ